MELDLELVSNDNITENVDTLPHLDQKSCLVDKELNEEAFNTCSSSEKLTREEDIAENTLYITTCEDSPDNTLEFSKKSSTNSFCLGDEFELESFVRQKENLSNVISSSSNLEDNDSNSILDSDLVDSLDETLLENSKDGATQDIHGKSSSDSSQFHDAQEEFQREQSSDSSEYQNLDHFIEKKTDKSTNNKDDSQVTLEVAGSLEKELDMYSSELLPSSDKALILPKETSSTSRSVCRDNLSILDDSTKYRDSNSINHEFSEKLVSMIDNQNNDFSVHKLGEVNQYIEDSVNVNILEFDKYDFSRKSEDGISSGCYGQKDSHLTVESDKEEPLLPLMNVKYPNLPSTGIITKDMTSIANGDLQRDENKSPSIELTAKEPSVSTSIFLSDSALNDQTTDMNIDPFKSNYENDLSKNDSKSRTEADINNLPISDFKVESSETSSGIDFPPDLNCDAADDKPQCTKKLRSCAQASPPDPLDTLQKPASKGRTSKARYNLLKRKLNEMLMTAEEEENKAIEHLVSMKEEKSQILQDIILEIERIATKFDF